jgi:hypothetical protein
LLELEGIAANCIEFGSANDETIFIGVLLSKRNVTVEALSHITLSPALTYYYYYFHE